MIDMFSVDFDHSESQGNQFVVSLHINGFPGANYLAVDSPLTVSNLKPTIKKLIHGCVEVRLIIKFEMEIYKK